MIYLVNYGQTHQSHLRQAKRFTSKRQAISEAARAVRDLGEQAWAHVIIPGEPVPVARWAGGHRVTV